MRFRKFIIAVAAVLGLSGMYAAGAAAASTPAPTIPYPKCFGTGATSVQLSGHIAYECLGVGNGQDGVGLYWSDNLYELNYYWHPASGEIVVNETFFKSCYDVQLERHGAPCALSAGVPTTVTPPVTGTDPYANGRLIWMADGCVVDAPTDTSTAPTTCSAIILAGGSVGPGRAMNPVELSSISHFWEIMDHYLPAKYDMYW